MSLYVIFDHRRYKVWSVCMFSSLIIVSDACKRFPCIKNSVNYCLGYIECINIKLLTHSNLLPSYCKGILNRFILLLRLVPSSNPLNWYVNFCFSAELFLFFITTNAPKFVENASTFHLPNFTVKCLFSDLMMYLVIHYRSKGLSPPPPFLLMGSY